MSDSASRTVVPRRDRFYVLAALLGVAALLDGLELGISAASAADAVRVDGQVDCRPTFGTHAPLALDHVPFNRDDLTLVPNVGPQGC